MSTEQLSQWYLRSISLFSLTPAGGYSDCLYLDNTLQHGSFDLSVELSLLRLAVPEGTRLGETFVGDPVPLPWTAE
jgi:hypothetical protein